MIVWHRGQQFDHKKWSLIDLATILVVVVENHKLKIFSKNHNTKGSGHEEHAVFWLSLYALSVVVNNVHIS